MRPTSAPLQRFYPCRCGAQHPAKWMIQGVPLLVCPALGDDDAIRGAATEKGQLYFVMGEGWGQVKTT